MKVVKGIILLLIYFALYKIYIPKISAFGCFDDCFNIVAGYFLGNGRELYSEIFFNHQPFMAYISFFIQKIFNPINMFELILRHRQVVLGISLVMNFFLVWRFGFWLIGFVLFYEFSKFYIFGDRFLAEGIVIYPLVYLFGLVLNVYNGKKPYLIDYFLASIFAWFVIFMREPFIPLALLFFIAILIKNKFQKIKLYAVFVFMLLTAITLFSFSLKEYFFNVVAVNYPMVFSQEARQHNLLGIGVINIFLYPISLLFGGEWNIFRKLLLGIALIFLLSSIHLIFKKKWKTVFLAIFFLGLANFRIVPPGKIFYASFHMIPWYGLFTAVIFFFLSFIYSYSRKLSIILIFILIVIFASMFIKKDSFIYKGVDPHYEFITNYGGQLQVGEVVRILSSPKDTLFLDGFDDLIYWQSKLSSPYKYSWYTSFMPKIERYKEARLAMFKENPPDFYYGTCPKEIRRDLILPSFVKDQYIPLYGGGKPSCLYIKKAKIASISDDQWKRTKEFLYELPPKREDAL